MKNNAPSIYKKVLNHINLDIPFKEKLWYYYNSITDEVTCKCGNPTTFNKNFRDGYKKYCSTQCAQSEDSTKERRRQTNLDKYGVDNVAKNSSIKEKTINTNKERYGTKSTFQNEDVKNKWKKNIKEKYDVDHVFQLEEVKDKIKNTNKERYDKEYYTQTDEYKKRVKETNLKNHNVEYYTQSEDYAKKTKETNLEKYDVEHYFNSDDYKEKLGIYLEKNGVEYLSQIESTRNKISEKKRKTIKDIYLKEHNLDLLESDKGGYIKFESKECGHISEMFVSMFYKRRIVEEVLCNTCNPFYEPKSEVEISEFLDSINQEYVRNTFPFSNEYQLDFYIESKGIGIEHNGLYWHGELNKNRKYHQEKTNHFNNNDIDLIHIWEDDWLDPNEKEIIKSIIKNRLGVYDRKIYARKTEFRKIENRKEVKDFLIGNHIQGYSNYSDSFGLYYKNELVSLMTFGKRTLSDKVELIRYCNKKDCIIIGGNEKLFKNSLAYIDDDIYSYQDTSMFNGNLYDKLGFELNSEGYETYWWVLQGKRYNRQNFTKKKLIKEGYNSDSSAIDIMHSIGAYRIYGCKQKVWKFNK